MAIDKNITYDDPVVQGGVDNYLGKQPQVQAPRKWQSAPDKPATELAYITEAEKDLILKANIHGGLEGGPNMGPSGIMSLDSFGDVGGAGASGGDTNAGGGAMEGRGFSGRNTNTTSEREFDRQKANQIAALQIAERKQAKDLKQKERANIATRTYGPLQKYTGERGFLGNLFRGANKYGYTDTYTSGPNEGEVKPGYGGRVLGGILSLLTGIPFAGSIIGNQIDKFKSKPKDMSEFNKLGLGGIKPGTLDFDPNAQINQTIDPAVLQGLSRFGLLTPTTPKTFSVPQGTPFNNPVGGVDQYAREMEALEAARGGQKVSVNELGGTLQDFYTNKNPGTDANTRFEVIDDNINFNTQPQGINTIDVGYPSNDLMAGLTKMQQKMLSGPQKNLRNIMGISDQEILNNISPFNDPEDPATLEEVQTFYGADGGLASMFTRRG